MTFERIRYENLSSRQQEAFNFQKVSAILADYGFTTIRLSTDWQCADFIAQHFDGKTFLPVQLKGRFTIAQQYCGKGLHICFRHKDSWYLYPHDDVLREVQSATTFCETTSWQRGGEYHCDPPSKKLLGILAPYRLAVA